MDFLTGADYQELELICPGGLQRNADLSSISQWRVGGNADLILKPSSTNELALIRRWFSDRDMHTVVIGMTSNLLFADEGLRVPCIQIGQRMSELSIKETEVKAQSGVWVPQLARKAMLAGLSGAEHICGIPGTLGGLICMNGGSQRKGIGSNIIKVKSVDKYGSVIIRSSDECDFNYRKSIYQTNDEIVSSALLNFNYGDKGSIRNEMIGILSDRRKKFPRKEPSCGSVFKSNPAMYSEIGPPGSIIEKLGFKGYKFGGALVSHDHANFIVNTGTATAEDILTLIEKISVSVETETGYLMDVEALHITPEGKVISAKKSEL